MISHPASTFREVDRKHISTLQIFTGLTYPLLLAIQFLDNLIIFLNSSDSYMDPAFKAEIGSSHLGGFKVIG